MDRTDLEERGGEEERGESKVSIRQIEKREVGERKLVVESLSETYSGR